jgi:hypothetical protein
MLDVRQSGSFCPIRLTGSQGQRSYQSGFGFPILVDWGFQPVIYCSEILIQKI